LPIRPASAPVVSSPSRQRQDRIAHWGQKIQEAYDRMTKKVLMAGWHSSVVDYSKYAGLTPEKLEIALRADEAKLNGKS